LNRLKSEFELTEKEGQVLMRGRNSVTKSKNNRRKNPVAYQDSTSFEALIGYMYINDPERCRELFVWLESVL
jgi:ribonuclease-3 family protein